jgi:hypothetical protein
MLKEPTLNQRLNEATEIIKSIYADCDSEIWEEIESIDDGQRISVSMTALDLKSIRQFMIGLEKTGKITHVRDCVQWGDCTVYGTVDGIEQKLFSYYIDELTIHSSDLIGMTPAEAIKFKRKKDEGYLRS